MLLSDDEARNARRRERDIGRSAVIGTPAEVVETLGAYRDAGVDEFIVPDFNLGTGAQRRELLDRFREEVILQL